MKCVIFDIDGTLNQTELYAIMAYQKALIKRNIFPTRDEIIDCIGLTPEGIIECFFGALNEEELIKWKKDIKDLEYSLMKKNAKTFEGVEEILKELLAMGYELGICSNAYMEHIENVLNTIGIRKYFSIIGSLEDGNNKTEVLRNIINQRKPNHICMVGDRVFDLEAAYQNNIPFVGCLYGYGKSEIKDAQHTIKSPRDLLGLIKEIFNKD